MPARAWIEHGSRGASPSTTHWRGLFNDPNPVLSLGDRVPPAILERKREIQRKYGLELVPKGTAHHVAITSANIAAAMNAFEECRAIK